VNDRRSEIAILPRGCSTGMARRNSLTSLFGLLTVCDFALCNLNSAFNMAPTFGFFRVFSALRGKPPFVPFAAFLIFHSAIRDLNSAFKRFIILASSRLCVFAFNPLPLCVLSASVVKEKTTNPDSKLDANDNICDHSSGL
jgi:hypothetical protein